MDSIIKRFCYRQHWCAFNFYAIQRFKGKAFFLTKNSLARRALLHPRGRPIRWGSGCCSYPQVIGGAFSDLRRIRRLRTPGKLFQDCHSTRVSRCYNFHDTSLLRDTASMLEFSRGSDVPIARRLRANLGRVFPKYRWSRCAVMRNADLCEEKRRECLHGAFRCNGRGRA